MSYSIGHKPIRFWGATRNGKRLLRMGYAVTFAACGDERFVVARSVTTPENERRKMTKRWRLYRTNGWKIGVVGKHSTRKHVVEDAQFIFSTVEGKAHLDRALQPISEDLAPCQNLDLVERRKDSYYVWHYIEPLGPYDTEATARTVLLLLTGDTKENENER